MAARVLRIAATAVCPIILAASAEARAGGCDGPIWGRNAEAAQLEESNYPLADLDRPLTLLKGTTGVEMGLQAGGVWEATGRSTSFPGDVLLDVSRGMTCRFELGLELSSALIFIYPGFLPGVALRAVLVVAPGGVAITFTAPIPTPGNSYEYGLKTGVALRYSPRDWIALKILDDVLTLTGFVVVGTESIGSPYWYGALDLPIGMELQLTQRTAIVMGLAVTAVAAEHDVGTPTILGWLPSAKARLSVLWAAHRRIDLSASATAQRLFYNNGPVFYSLIGTVTLRI